MKHLFAIAPIVLLAACGATLPDTPALPTVPPVAEDTCNANRYAPLIGQDATALERVLILGQVRVIRPGMAVTMDFRPERLNFDIDGANTVSRIYCG